MKQSKFSLADVLTVLTALAFGFVCFLGKNFSTMGNTSLSITWAVIITVLLAGTAFIAKLLKRTSRNFKTSFILEIGVLLLFTGLLVFFAYSPFPHYFNVSAKKTKIQDKLKISITKAENMFADYEQYAENRKLNYQGQLETAIATKLTGGDYVKYGFSDGIASDATQMRNKMFTIHADLYPTNYSDTASKNGIKEVATAWLARAKKTTKSWKPGIVNVVNDIESKSTDWLNQLISFSQRLEQGESRENTTVFPFPLTFTDVKKYFTTPGKPTPLSIGLAAVAYLLMLLSYLISKRSSKTMIGTTKQKGEYDIDF